MFPNPMLTKSSKKLNAELAEKRLCGDFRKSKQTIFYGTHLLRCRQEREVNLWQYIKKKKTNTWRVLYRYTDWNGERKQTQKRGFKTKREAQSWEREQLNKLGGDLDMNFKSFVEHYSEDMQTRLKENTWETKKHIIDKKLVPYFGKLKMCNITAQQIITWQNELINYKDDKGKPYSPVYLKTIHNQLSAIFNHAVRYYNLKENPCQKAGSMGKKEKS